MTEPTSTPVRVRRAPRFGAFMVVGGALAAIATLIVTSLFPSDPAVGFIATAAYVCLFTIPAGVVVGAVIALALDRRATKRARTVAAERQEVDAASSASDV